MRVSVIIPAWNEAARIQTSIRRAWTAGADEVLVADGGSTDGTAELAEELSGRCIRGARGRAAQQNAAAAEATGDVLLFLHADNWLPERAIQQIRDSLTPDGSPFGAFRQRIEAPGGRFRALEWGNSRRVQWLGLPFGDQGLFVRRKDFQELGGFPPVRLMEDVMLAQLLRRRGWPRLLPGPLHVDARRWLHYGVVRQTARNWCLLTAYQLGVHPDRLAPWYAPHHRPASPS